MRKVAVLFLIIALTIMSACPVLAATSDTRSEDAINEQEDLTRADGYYTWRVYSTAWYNGSYGSWRNGPSGTGPATLTLTDSNASSISVTNTITGSYANLNNISAALGVTINQAQSHSVSYSISIPSGARRQIIYRPYYYVYKVVERQYYVDHGTESYTGSSKTSYVYVFNNWDYSWTTL